MAAGGSTAAQPYHADRIDSPPPQHDQLEIIFTEPGNTKVTDAKSGNQKLNMPLYQLFAIAKPTVPVSGLAAALRKVGSNVYSSGGVVTEIKSYGEQELAYDIKTAAGKYREGQMLSMNFMVGPTALADLNHNLKVNEDILRYVVLKMKPYDRLPRTTKELNKLRESVEQAQTASFPPVPEGFEPSSL